MNSATLDTDHTEKNLLKRMNKRAIVSLLAVLALCSSLVFIYINRPNRGPKMRLKPYQALGEVVAKEISNLLGHKGEVLVIAEDFGKYNMAWVDVELDSFKGALKKEKGVHLQAVERVTDPMISEKEGNRFAAEDFSKFLQTHPKIDGLVLFANFPPSADRELRVFRDAAPKMVAISSYGPALKRLLETKVVQVAIVPRIEPSSANSNPRTLREWFDNTYEVLTSDKVPALAY